MAKEFETPSAGGGGSNSPIISPSKAPPARLTLHLGVIDVPYAHYSTEKTPQAKKGKANKPLKKKSAVTKTTGDVAEILESKYGVMDTFAFARLPDIAKELEDSLAGALENLMAGGSTSQNPFGKAESSIGTMFKTFISSQQVEQMGIAGTPTQAALDGVSHRLLHPYAKASPRRPSFMDTHMYVDHFKAWFE